MHPKDPDRLDEPAHSRRQPWRCPSCGLENHGVWDTCAWCGTSWDEDCEPVRLVIRTEDDLA